VRLFNYVLTASGKRPRAWLHCLGVANALR
jgi:hypothetical protein